MDIVILGGDVRMAALAAMLGQRGRAAIHTSDAAEAAALIPAAGTVIAQCPPKPGITVEGILALAAAEACVCLCGPARYDGGDPRVIDLWRDEQLLRENALLTAEGAVAAAMRAGRRCIRGMDCVVVGWGRVGRALAELLVSMGARVTVASRSEAHRNRAVERGAEAVPPEALLSALPGAALVFNTAPAPVLDEERLSRVHRDAMVIDLASAPYGVDLRAAWRMGLRAWREPGLPGRYCPESAAAALLRAMERGEAL